MKDVCNNIHYCYWTTSKVVDRYPFNDPLPTTRLLICELKVDSTHQRYFQWEIALVGSLSTKKKRFFK
jgi:hypothetical protein